MAIVASENPFHRSGPLWSLEDVEIARALHEHELLVKMVATGVCHADILATEVPEGTMGIEYPKIVGHEGSHYPKYPFLAPSTLAPKTDP